MNRKLMPVILMLVTGACTCIATYIKNYSILEKLVALFVTMVLFYGVGCFVKSVLDSFDKQNERVRLEQEKARLEEQAAQEQATGEQAAQKEAVQK